MSCGRSACDGRADERYGTMKRTQQRYGTPDAENPEITADEWKAMRPAHEVLPKVFGRDGRVRAKYRGKQKTPTKQAITIRLRAETLAAYRKTGKGWQTRLSDAVDGTVSQLRGRKRPTSAARSRSART